MAIFRRAVRLLPFEEKKRFENQPIFYYYRRNCSTSRVDSAGDGCKEKDVGDDERDMFETALDNERNTSTQAQARVGSSR